MKKSISLMPKKTKKKKEISNIKKYGTLFVSIPLLISVYNMGTNVLKTEELERLKENQEEATSIKGQISAKQAEVQNNEGMIRSLELSGVPLNKFMLFLATEMPNDIRIYEIRNGVEEQAPVAQPTTDPNAVNGGIPTSGVPSESIPEANPMEQVTSSVVGVIENLQGGEQKIVIKGAGLRVDSVAKLVDGLKLNNPYISDIKISDIQNYKNEEFNYKMFEMEIYIR